jgi:HK97 family phage prohead protease/HK97 family phage major capsid protein
MKHLQLNLKLKSDKEGTFTAYANTFSELDHAGDITQKGAFLKSIAQHKANGTMPKLLQQHEHSSMPIGVITKMYEDSHGLVIEGEFALKTKSGSEAYELVKMKAITQFSIGYNTIEEKSTAEGNLLIELDLKEVSLVNFPCNEGSNIISIKNEDLKEEEVVEVEETEDETEEAKAFEDMTSAEKAKFFQDEADEEEKKAFEAAEEEKAKADALEEEKAVEDEAVEAEKSATFHSEKMRTSLRHNLTHTKAGKPVTSQKNLTVAGYAGLAIDESLAASVIERGRNLPTALGMIETVTATSTDVRDLVEDNFSSALTGTEQLGSSAFADSGTAGFIESFGALVNEQSHYFISDEAMADPAINLEEVHTRQVALAVNNKYETEVWYGTGDATSAGSTSFHGVLASGYDAVDGLNEDGTRAFGTFQHFVNSAASLNLNETITECIDSINDRDDIDAKFFMNKKSFSQLKATIKAESATGGFKVLDIQHKDGVWTIEGYPVVFSEQFRAFNFGTDNFLCVFGDIANAYKQYIHPSSILRNEFSVDGATKVLNRERRSGLLKDSNALKMIVMAA